MSYAAEEMAAHLRWKFGYLAEAVIDELLKMACCGNSNDAASELPFFDEVLQELKRDDTE